MSRDNFLVAMAGPLCSTAGWTGQSTLKPGLMGMQPKAGSVYA